MKIIALPVFFFFLLPINPSFAQQADVAPAIKNTGITRCGTMKIIADKIKADPALPGKWKKEGEKRYNQYLQHTQIAAARPLDNVVIIPVVFHLVANTATLNMIRDRDIYDQLEILNEDFQGKKAATYTGLFASEIESKVGKLTNLKFVLARKKPDGSLTNGIERRSTNKTFSGITLSQLKHVSGGGLDAWDTDKYLNVWCCIFADGSLGISTVPYSDIAEEQGVSIDIITLGGNTCREYYTTYSEGATLAHEVGHYFYLYHAFGDLSFCNNTDFDTEPGWPLPESSSADDTPPEKGDDNTMYGNVSGNYSDGCSPFSYGVMYQNFMNYYDDRALYMFSEGQKKRMNEALTIYRPGLLTTDGAIPPVAITDAYLVKLQPQGKCDTRAPIINNSPLKTVIRNYGTVPMTSVYIGFKIDNGIVISADYAVSLAPGQDTLLTVWPIISSEGNHSITVYTAAPNAGPDNFLSNDTVVSYITIVSNSITAPLTENFTDGTFPPVGWSINNPQKDTWIWYYDAGVNGNGCASVQNFDYDGAAQMDDLISPPIDLGTSDSAALTFQVAHGCYRNVTSDWDGLELYVSGDGGLNYQLIYKKTGPSLSSLPDFTGLTPFDPGTNDEAKWRTESIDLSRYIIHGSPMLIKFRNVTAFGNNTYIDNVKVSAGNLYSRDAYAFNIQNLPALVCNGSSFTPSVNFGSRGKDPLQSVKLNYKVDDGPVNTVNWTNDAGIVRGQVAQAVLGTISNIPSGQHQLIVYTSEPNGLTDNNIVNDTAYGTFTIIPSVNGSVSVDFETPAFPPLNWGVTNPDNDITWDRTIAAAQAGSGSLQINNFNAVSKHTKDMFVSANIQLDPFDSAIVRFDYAYLPGISYPGSTGAPLDTLEVALSKDCGATLTTVWKKWGEELQTVNDPNYSSLLPFTPASIDNWKNVHISITSQVKDNNEFQVFFIVKGNKQNNLYIDNINIYGKSLPKRLRDQGYLIYPNPFNNSFKVHHWRLPSDLRSIYIFTAAGQMVWSKDYPGNASSEMDISPAFLPKGVYILKMNYVDKVVTERIIKN